MPHSEIERAGAQAGTDDAGTSRPLILLVALLGSGVAWSIHLLASSVVVAFACSTGWGGARSALVIVSVAALTATAGSGWLAWTHWHIARVVDRPEDDSWDARMGERTARASFLMVMGLVAAILFGIGIGYQALTIWTVPLCEPGVSA